MKAIRREVKREDTGPMLMLTVHHDQAFFCPWCGEYVQIDEMHEDRAQNRRDRKKP